MSEEEIGLFHNDGGKKTKEITSERKKILKTMAENLKKLNFTLEEVRQVLDVINEAQDDILQIKEDMEGTNIDVSAEEAVYVTDKKTTEIRVRNEKMALDVRAKISEILKNKG